MDLEEVQKPSCTRKKRTRHSKRAGNPINRENGMEEGAKHSSESVWVKRGRGTPREGMLQKYQKKREDTDRGELKTSENPGEWGYK